jgi:hypothetical protein
MSDETAWRREQWSAFGVIAVALLLSSVAFAMKATLLF